jgi:hypothetical protein
MGIYGREIRGVVWRRDWENLWTWFEFFLDLLNLVVMSYYSVVSRGGVDEGYYYKMILMETFYGRAGIRELSEMRRLGFS